MKEDAISSLLASTRDKFKGVNHASIYPLILRIARNPEHPHWNRAINLWNSGDQYQDQYRRDFSPILREVMTKQPTHPQWHNIVNKLWNDTKARQELSPLLFEIAKISDHPQQWCATEMLWDSQDAHQTQNREELTPTLLELAQTPASPHHWQAIQLLWGNNSLHARGEERDQRARQRSAVQPILLEIAHSPSHPQEWEALEKLWRSDTLQPQIRDELKPLLEEVALNEDHPRQWWAVDLLWNTYERQMNFPYRTAIYSAVYKIAGNGAHPHQWEALRDLWGVKHQEHLDLRPILLEVSRNQWDKIQKLWEFNWPYGKRWPLYHQLIKEELDLLGCVVSIAKDDSHPHQWKSILLLWDAVHDSAHAPDHLYKLQCRIRNEIRPYMKRIAKTPNHPHCEEARLHLEHEGRFSIRLARAMFNSKENEERCVLQ